MKPKTLWPIRNLRGRYSYDPGANAVWGHFEEHYIPVEDGVIRVRVIKGSQGESAFSKYADMTRTNLTLPIDALFAFNGESYINIGPLLSRGHMSVDRGVYEDVSNQRTIGGER